MLSSLLQSLHIGAWDILLITVVSLQATVMAYLYAPKWKALMISLPIPFTISAMAVGRQVDITNVLGFVLLVMFTHGVRILHYHLRLPIIASIVIAALGYCGIGWGLAKVTPNGEAAFWIACITVFLAAVLLFIFSPHRDEPGHREPMPVWIKLPLTVLVTIALVLMKKGLHGFMTLFPLVGVFAAYEARRSLWTISRQIPVVVITMMPMVVVSRVTQPFVGLGLSLFFAWIAFLLVFIPSFVMMWRKAEKEASQRNGMADQQVTLQS